MTDPGPDYTMWWWRAGGEAGCTLYAQEYGEPTDSDPLIGAMNTPELAQAACTAHNSVTPHPGGF